MRYGLRAFALVLVGISLAVLPTSSPATTFTLETIASPIMPVQDLVFLTVDRGSIALDAAGNPHVAYPDALVPELKYAVKSGGVWTIEAVAPSGGDPIDDLPKMAPSIAIDAFGNPHIAFYDSPTASLRYASKSAGVWTIEVVDASGNVGLVPSLALDAAGNPHIAHYDQANFDLKYSTKSGGVWVNETVDSDGIVGGGAKLALDALGNPHISYPDFTDATLRYATKSGGSWSFEALFTTTVGSAILNDIAIDSSGRPHISYHRAVGGDLYYTFKSGGVWTTEAVDVVGSVGADNSIQLTSSGAPRISYRDLTNRNLKFASKVGGSWVVEVVDAPGATGYRSDLALDAFGNPRIVYLDLTNLSVRYASAEASGGFVSGSVLAGCPSPGTSLAGVTVDAFEVGSMNLSGTATTDATGNYTLGPLAPGDHNIVMVTPLGYTASPHEQVVSVTNGTTATLDFALQCVPPSGDVRSVGFWKHQTGVAVSGKGSGAVVDGATLCGYLDLVAQHFNSNDVNPVVVYVPPVSGDCDDKLLVASTLLNLQGSVEMRDRARQQLLALLLNVASGRLGTMSVISADGATASQAITYCDNLIDSPAGDYERAKTIADDINNGRIVPAGMIPLTTTQIAYRRGLALRTFTMTDNPGPGGRTFHFTMADRATVRLSLYDVAGRLVSKIIDGPMDAGPQTVAWNGTADRGTPAANGIYFARLETADGSRTLKVVQLAR